MKEKVVFTTLALITILALKCCSSKLKSGKDVYSPSIEESETLGIPVIFETDMTLDVDDVGALAVLHGLQTEGRVNLLDLFSFHSV